ncbi:hypothetical protein Taro_050397 [Colocasia esculenta]|uniref:Uncharacterized protein n=1 Tax=Colocasia esculenta TaxID=4460 RepID=A0A843XDT0_COLES|nr:hypothetical protein [Colocasia esculenta]
MPEKDLPRRSRVDPLLAVPLTHQKYIRITREIMKRWRGRGRSGNASELEKMVDEAWMLGARAWEEMESYEATGDGNQEATDITIEAKPESCPTSLSTSQEEMAAATNNGEQLMFLPCGLAAGSSITVVGTPQAAHEEYVPQLVRLMCGNGRVLVSQFMVELQGLKAVFTLDDAIGLSIKGNIDVHSVYATSHPSSHPSFSLQRVLEMSEKWKSGPLPDDPVDLLMRDD